MRNPSRLVFTNSPFKSSASANATLWTKPCSSPYFDFSSPNNFAISSSDETSHMNPDASGRSVIRSLASCSRRSLWYVMARRQPACCSFCAMAQAILRLLARPKITAVFCGSVTDSSQGDSVLYVQLLLIWRWPERFSNAVEGFLDFFDGIAEDYGAAVGTAHGAIGFGEGGEEPFHFCLVERHIYLDGGVARGGGGDFCLQRFDGDGGVFPLDAVEDFS